MTRLLLTACVAISLIRAEIKPIPPSSDLVRLALEDQEQGRYEEAVRLLDEALESTPSGSVDEARLANRLGSAHQDLGEYFEAERAYRRSLRILRTAGPEARDLTASTLNNLGALRIATGKLELARRTLRESLEIREDLIAADNGVGGSSIVPLLSNLGSVELRLGAHDRAVELYRNSLSICRREGGEGGEREAAILHNLATVYHDRGDFDQAASLIEETLEIWESTLRYDHPIVGASLTSLAAIRLEQNRLEDAEAAVERGLAILRETLPAHHPHISAGLTIYSKILRRTGRRRLARQFMKQARAAQARSQEENLLDHTVDVSELRQSR